MHKNTHSVFRSNARKKRFAPPFGPSAITFISSCMNLSNSSNLQSRCENLPSLFHALCVKALSCQSSHLHNADLHTLHLPRSASIPLQHCGPKISFISWSSSMHEKPESIFPFLVSRSFCFLLAFSRQHLHQILHALFVFLEVCGRVLGIDADDHHCAEENCCTRFSDARRLLHNTNLGRIKKSGGNCLQRLENRHTHM